MSPGYPALAPGVRAALLQALDDSGRSEICGFLFGQPVGRGDGQGFRRLRNYGGGGEFRIDQSELDSVLRDLERHGAPVLAFVHSHRSGLGLSSADRAALRGSRWPWLVVMRHPAGLAGQWYAPGPGAGPGQGMPLHTG